MSVCLCMSVHECVLLRLCFCVCAFGEPGAAVTVRPQPLHEAAVMRTGWPGQEEESERETPRETVRERADLHCWLGVDV